MPTVQVSKLFSIIIYYFKILVIFSHSLTASNASPSIQYNQIPSNDYNEVLCDDYPAPTKLGATQNTVMKSLNKQWNSFLVIPL